MPYTIIVYDETAEINQEVFNKLKSDPNNTKYIQTFRKLTLDEVRPAKDNKGNSEDHKGDSDVNP